ncbi:MAG: thiopurine S-methyltransferase [Wenzhouxiangellaceae bacterium]
MDANFWHERWQRREIGFHRDSRHWGLPGHWSDVVGDDRSSVLVPLCGKSLDLRWLAARGHAVTGLELSGQAIAEFFQHAGITPDQEPSDHATRWSAGPYTLIEGDFFDWRAREPFRLLYDRAALVALPPSMRPRYLAHLHGQLAADARGLLITVEYDQNQMKGPPFAVPESELRDTPGFEFTLLERRDVLGQHAGFAERGLTALHEFAWRVAVRPE